MNIIIRRDSYQLPTVYVNRRPIAGITSPAGIWIGKLVITRLAGRIRLCWDGRWF